MYFSKTNNFFHGIMFHHFHDDGRHKKGQGSINKDELYKLVKFIGRKNILNAEEFIYRFINKKLKSNNVCFTFDDGIKAQYDVALPVLEDLNIKSFFLYIHPYLRANLTLLKYIDILEQIIFLILMNFIKNF